MKFNIQSVEHELAVVGQDIVKGAKAVDAFLQKAVAEGKVLEPEAEALTAMVDPAAVPVERAAFAALGLVAKAANCADAAAAAKGLSIALDQETWAEFQQIYTTLKSRSASAPASK